MSIRQVLSDQNHIAIQYGPFDMAHTTQMLDRYSFNHDELISFGKI